MTTVNAAIRAALVGITALGERIGLDEVPEGETFPYVTMSPELSMDPALLGDAQVLALTETAQVDLWQKRSEENIFLRDAVLNALNGLSLPEAALHLRVSGVARLVEPPLEPGFDVVHHAFTLGFARLIPPTIPVVEEP